MVETAHSPFVKDLITVLDWGGTFIFALSGGLLGVKKRFDLFGVLFLSFVVAVVGGITRDLLIGAVPPAAITEIHYFLIAIVGGLVTFWWYPSLTLLQRKILVLDAVGLGLFAVIGAQKAIDFGINPLMAGILGMLTGIGGGMLRDLLAGEVPFVLKGDIYALAALTGGAVVSIGHVMAISPSISMLLGAAACILLRLLAIFRGWRAPVARWGGDHD
ncbi:trimeric intracellular cation channel family protein [Neoroseomonas soli]|uniref:Trimeric intracellular cation channel family protein n=1 Tax=Neoroseomonas soli TaxID=1081025 RepID=A0A9X9WSZ3_9PROT|nr:trimeric intracellular cation channel family protein [Neoroseomonas soli]MBR0670272.1 trimeric intracellular cation channel family protein [Neoroseomonas soli]